MLNLEEKMQPVNHVDLTVDAEAIRGVVILNRIGGFMLNVCLKRVSPSLVFKSISLLCFVSSLLLPLPSYAGVQVGYNWKNNASISTRAATFYGFDQSSSIIRDSSPETWLVYEGSWSWWYPVSDANNQAIETTLTLPAPATKFQAYGYFPNEAPGWVATAVDASGVAVARFASSSPGALPRRDWITLISDTPFNRVHFARADRTKYSSLSIDFGEGGGAFYVTYSSSTAPSPATVYITKDPLTIITAQNCEMASLGFGSCSATCGGGTQTEALTVLKPAENGGTACREPITQACNTQACTAGDLALIQLPILQSQLDVVNVSLAKSQSQLTMATSNLNACLSQGAQNEITIAELQGENKTLKGKIAELNGLNAALSASLADLRAQNAALSASNADLNGQNAALQVVIASHRAQIALLTERLAHLQAAIDALPPGQRKVLIKNGYLP